MWKAGWTGCSALTLSVELCIMCWPSPRGARVKGRNFVQCLYLAKPSYFGMSSWLDAGKVGVASDIEVALINIRHSLTSSASNIFGGSRHWGWVLAFARIDLSTGKKFRVGAVGSSKVSTFLAINVCPSPITGMVLVHSGNMALFPSRLFFDYWTLGGTCIK